MSTLLSQPGHSGHFQVVRNGNAVCYMYFDGVGGNFDTSAGSFVLRLNKGDVISIQNADPGEAVWGGYYSYFSGFLLKEVDPEILVVG
ncbi:hypothetical protein DPMN_093055 [Dreissena polymorpha]|uniref:C1q domain-containing protein n=2 Tax=Dreissena polymorpha TaxID=45954 RepID=A0A9D4L530_DREPO|nr:hypothetical protein DPMN_093055 [Dreissena polymorpha]